MASDIWQSIPPDPNGGEAPDMNNPAAWPHEPYPGGAPPARRGWMTTALAVLGSAMPIIGAVVTMMARRRSRRRGIMAAMPSNLSSAEQMVRDRMSGGMAARGGGKMRALVAILAVAIAGWGIRRTLAHS